MKDQLSNLTNIINKYNDIIDKLNYNNTVFIVNDIIVKIKDIKTITIISVSNNKHHYSIRLYDNACVSIDYEQNDEKDYTGLIEFYKYYNSLIHKLKRNLT